MAITPQVAPMANQAFETSQFIFFLKHPNVTCLRIPILSRSEPLLHANYMNLRRSEIEKFLAQTV